MKLVLHKHLHTTHGSLFTMENIEVMFTSVEVKEPKYQLGEQNHVGKKKTKELQRGKTT